jgi:uncharacterized damage-inducible protein DinB
MKEQLLATLENSKNYTLGVAAAMPDKSYDFKPTESVWNFGELLHHIAYGIQWWQKNYVEGIETAWNPPAVKNNKKEIESCLTEAYASLQKTVSKTATNDKVINGFYATLDHITHHRGQAIIYLRCKGITPPEYTY